MDYLTKLADNAKLSKSELIRNILLNKTIKVTYEVVMERLVQISIKLQSISIPVASDPSLSKTKFYNASTNYFLSVKRS